MGTGTIATPDIVVAVAEDSGCAAGIDRSRTGGPYNSHNRQGSKAQQKARSGGVMGQPGTVTSMDVAMRAASTGIVVRPADPGRLFRWQRKSRHRNGQGTEDSRLEGQDQRGQVPAASHNSSRVQVYGSPPNDPPRIDLVAALVAGRSRHRHLAFLAEWTCVRVQQDADIRAERRVTMRARGI
jgi:hypothetical protein